MKAKFLAIFSGLVLFLTACGGISLSGSGNNPPANSSQPGNGRAGEANGANNATSEKALNNTGTNNSAPREAAGAQTGQPKTVHDFFTLLPEKYFALEGCDKATDKNCDKARTEYLKMYLEVEDTANGYLKAGCDGGQSCLTMALFKRPNGTYLVAVNNSFEMGEDYYFLDYANGKWTDVSAQVVPNFSKKNMYELPRQGTTVQVFAKKYDAGEEAGKGAKLYDLEWKDGKFAKK